MSRHGSTVTAFGCFILAGSLTLILSIFTLLFPAMAASDTLMQTWWGPRPDSWLWPTVILGLTLLGLMLVRRGRSHVRIGFASLVTLVFSSFVLGMSAYLPCVGNDNPFLNSITYTLTLYLGVLEPGIFGPDVNGLCRGNIPLAIQLARFLSIAATFWAAVQAAGLLFRAQIDRLSSHFANDVDVIVGLTEDSIPLIRSLVHENQAARFLPAGRHRQLLHRIRHHRRRVVVITANADDPLALEAKSRGALIYPSDPLNIAAIRRVMLYRNHNVALHRFYAVGPQQSANIAACEAVESVLGGTRQSSEDPLSWPFVPRLTARFANPQAADEWRVAEIGTTHWFKDAITVDDATARHLVAAMGELPAGSSVLIAGDSALTLAVLDELAWNCWTATRLSGERSEPPTVVLIGTTADRTLRDWENHRAPCSSEVRVTAQTVEWEDACLQYVKLNPAPGAILLTDPPQIRTDAQASRVARLTGTRVIGLGRHADLQLGSPDAKPGQFTAFPPTLLGTRVEGSDVPEDSWTSLARFEHNLYLASAPANGRSARMAWPDDGKTRLDEFYRQDNLRQLRLLMANVSDRADWKWETVTANDIKCAVPDDLLTELAEAEHVRWLNYRLAAGWACPTGNTPLPQEPKERAIFFEEHKLNPNMRDWGTGAPYVRSGNGRSTLQTGANDSSAATQIAEWNKHIVRGLIDDLYHWGLGLQPADPSFRLTDVTTFQRTGIVRAEKLTTSWQTTTSHGDVLTAAAGDWKVIGADGQARPVSATAFPQSYVPDGSNYRRIGTVRGRRLSAAEEVASPEGTLHAAAGMWFLTDPNGDSWAVDHSYLVANYEALVAEKP